MKMVVDVFLQKKTEKLREEERGPNRYHERQDVAQGNVERADCQVRAKHRFNIFEELRSQPKKVQHQVQPKQKRHELDCAAHPPVKHWAMKLNDAQRRKRSYMQ